MPVYEYTWYSDKEYTSPVTSSSDNLSYFPGNDTPTETGIVWSLIEYGDEYLATYRLADNASPERLPRLSLWNETSALVSQTVYQPFDSRFNGAKGGKNYAALDTLSPTLSEAEAALVKTLVVDSGITGGYMCSLAYMSSVTTVIVSSDFDRLMSGAFHDCANLDTLFVAGTTALQNTIDLSSIVGVRDVAYMFKNCESISNIKFPAQIEISIITAYAFENCYSLERVWLDGDEMPVSGTIDLGSAQMLMLHDGMFKNTYLINSLVLPDNTTISGHGLADIFTGAGKNNPYSDTITVNLICTAGSAAETAIKAQPVTAAVMALKVALNGSVLTNAGDIEIDIGELG